MSGQSAQSLKTVPGDLTCATAADCSATNINTKIKTLFITKWPSGFHAEPQITSVTSENRSISAQSGAFDDFGVFLDFRFDVFAVRCRCRQRKWKYPETGKTGCDVRQRHDAIDLGV